MDKWNGIITSYTVDYELLHAVGEQAENSVLAPYSILSVSIPQPGFPLANNPDPTRISLPLQTEMVLLEDLQEYYVYQFTVYLQNSAGRSESSQSVTQQLPGAGILLYLLYCGLSVSIILFVFSHNFIIHSSFRPTYKSCSRSFVLSLSQNYMGTPRAL